MRVKIIANKPAHGQTGIEFLIGEVFTGKRGCDMNGKPDKTVIVRVDKNPFNGPITLNPGEYKVIRSKS